MINRLYTRHKYNHYSHPVHLHTHTLYHHLPHIHIHTPTLISPSLRWNPPPPPKKKNSVILNRLGQGSFSNQRCRIQYFAFLLKLNDRRSVEFLAFIRPVVQWITWQWSFALILSPWNARLSLLLVLGKYSYTLGQQLSWHVPPYFWQISHASPLHMPENRSEKGLFPCVFSWVLCDNWPYLMGQLFLCCTLHRYGIKKNFVSENIILTWLTCNKQFWC